jgi:hypothetical protein
MVPEASPKKLARTRIATNLVVTLKAAHRRILDRG